MGIVFLATGSPKTGRSVNELAQELSYAIGRNFDLGKAAPSKPDALGNYFSIASGGVVKPGDVIAADQ